MSFYSFSFGHCRVGQFRLAVGINNLTLGAASGVVVCKIEGTRSYFDIPVLLGVFYMMTTITNYMTSV
jgi:hypothetical protein